MKKYDRDLRRHYRSAEGARAYARKVYQSGGAHIPARIAQQMHPNGKPSSGQCSATAYYDELREFEAQVVTKPHPSVFAREQSRMQLRKRRRT